MCDPLSQAYKIKGGSLPDLGGVSSSMTLSSDAAALPDVKVELKLLKSGVVNIHWTFADSTNLKTPFEVPLTVIDAKKDQLHDNSKSLSDFVVVTQQQGSNAVSITIKNEDNTNVWSLNALVFSEYLNWIAASALTASDADFKGVLGLGQHTSPDLFLADGVHTMWARDINNPVDDGKAPGKNNYATHPFYMAKATDKTWFGVFTNLANAQDWWIKNNKTTGIVDINTIATGGATDLYFMMAETPTEVT